MMHSGYLKLWSQQVGGWWSITNQLLPDGFSAFKEEGHKNWRKRRDHNWRRRRRKRRTGFWVSERLHHNQVMETQQIGSGLVAYFTWLVLFSLADFLSEYQSCCMKKAFWPLGLTLFKYLGCSWHNYKLLKVLLASNHWFLSWKLLLYVPASLSIYNQNTRKSLESLKKSKNFGIKVRLKATAPNVNVSSGDELRLQISSLQI